MDSAENIPESYLVEASGWDLEGKFFVEHTNLLWSAKDGKRLKLRRALPGSSIIFVRLLAAGPAGNSVPVIYVVDPVHSMARNGQFEMCLTKLDPRFKDLRSKELRSKESNGLPIASKLHGGAQRTCEPGESPAQLELEEVL